MSCPNCGSDLEQSNLTPSGFVKTCASCNITLPGQQIASVPKQEVSEPPIATLSAKPAPVAQPLVAHPSLAKAEPSAKTLPLTPATILRYTRKRAAELKRSIARDEKALARDKKELESLLRVLDAADNLDAADARPRAVVRSLRTTA